MGIKQVNQKLKAFVSSKGVENVELELFKGHGYFYFAFTKYENGECVVFETENVMVPYFYMCKDKEWLQLGIDMFEEQMDLINSVL